MAKISKENIKSLLEKMFNLEDPGVFVLTINRLLVRFSLGVVLFSMIVMFFRFLFSLELALAFSTLFFGPFVFLFIKYILSFYLVFWELVSSATKFYKTNTRE
jgi:hypothetical protein